MSTLPPTQQPLMSRTDPALGVAEHVPRVDTSGCCVCCTGGLEVLLYFGSGLACLAPCSGCKVLNPRTAAVAITYGKYLGTFTKQGLYCVNPCGLEWRTVSINNKALELQAVKCADSAGNSILISGVITFRIVDPATAVLNMDNPEYYVHTQGQAILKRVASAYRYITYDGSPSLTTEQTHLGDQMRSMLQAAVMPAGVEVISFQLSDLAYAPEIASTMLVRQRAVATLDAQKLLVQGAVGIAADAADEVTRKGGAMDANAKTRFMTDLMLVLSSERGAQPTFNITSSGK